MPGRRGPPLAVSEVLGAAAVLDDATALLDGGAVVGLPDGLRERVEHLVGQLLQVGAVWVGSRGYVFAVGCRRGRQVARLVEAPAAQLVQVGASPAERLVVVGCRCGCQTACMV